MSGSVGGLTAHGKAGAALTPLTLPRARVVAREYGWDAYAGPDPDTLILRKQTDQDRAFITTREAMAPIWRDPEDILRAMLVWEERHS